MYSSYRKNDIEAKIEMVGVRPLDVMVTGVTGAGKSTTLNSLFNRRIVKSSATLRVKRLQ